MTNQNVPDPQPSGQPDPSIQNNTQIHANTVNAFFNSAAGIPLDSPIQTLPPRPDELQVFREPRHDQLRAKLDDHRLILLSSYQANAALAAAYSLVHDEHFRGYAQTVVPSRGPDRDRSDLDLFAMADEQFLGKRQQILVIEIRGKSLILDSALEHMTPLTAALIRDKLARHESYMILVVNEDAVVNRTDHPEIPCFSVSHLRYLLDPTGRGDEFERRVLDAIAHAADSITARELYPYVAKRLKDGAEKFEDFILELERTRRLPIKDPSRPVTPQDFFREEAEIHRAACFVATYFPRIGHGDFDRLVLTLIADQTMTVERSRDVTGQDGTVTLIRERIQEPCAERWIRAADRISSECHMKSVSSDGAWIVEFSEPSLRDELRAFFDEHHPYYLKRQCQILQERGALFDIDLSSLAVEALVRLFVERAIIDPGLSGVWLFNLVQGLRIQLSGSPSGNSQEEVLDFLLKQLAVEAQLRAHFYGRLALLIREMLDHEPLRRMVRDFFEFLIASRQHEALLDVIVDLARRLRFAPHFDPLVWMRRLLDQGKATVRQQAADRLSLLARDSGPRIYEFLTVIRTWLPDATRTADRYSISNCVALDFPFHYCLAVAKTLREDRFGQWPSHHPLFYALPADPAQVRAEIGKLADWILDPRGAALEEAEENDPILTAEAMRIARVGDLIEHWAWVLEGALNEGHSEGRALFRIVVEEINQRLGPDERSWLRQSWQRRQDDYVVRATSTTGLPRTFLINRRARLEQLRQRFV